MPKYKDKRARLQIDTIKCVHYLSEKGFTQEEIGIIMNRSRYWVIMQLSTEIVDNKKEISYTKNIRKKKRT